MPATSTHFDVTLGAAVVGNVRDATYDPGVSPIAGPTSNGLDVGAYHVGRHEPVARLSTEDLAALLTASAAFLAEGLCIKTSALSIPLVARGECGTFAGGSVHHTVTAANARITPTSLGWGDGPDAVATLDCEVRPFSADGLAPSAILNADQPAPATVRAQVPVFGPGPLVVSGTSLPALTGVRVQPGLRVVAEFHGLPHARRIVLVERRPTIEATFESVAAMQGTAAKISAGALTGAIAYMRKRNGATYVADNVAEHVKVTLGGGLQVSGGVSSRTGANAACTLTLMGTDLAGTAASTIPPAALA